MLPIARMRGSRLTGILPIISALLLAGWQPTQAASTGSPPPVSRQIERLLAAKPAELNGKIRDASAPEPFDAGLSGYYRDRAFKPAWLAESKPSPRARALRRCLEAAGEEGLRPEDYRAEDIGRLWPKPDAASQAKLDLLLTQGFVRYALDAGRGRDEARRLEDPSYAEPPMAPSELPAAIRKGLDTPEPERFLESQAPRHPHYQLLKRALQSYRAIAKQGGWTPIPAGPSLQAGMSDPRVRLLRLRLALSGDSDGADRASCVFDPALQAAVRRFQQRHALPTDGVLGPETLAAMNVPVEQRIRQIVLNLERWRWRPVDLSGRHIWVNIPGFALAGTQDGIVELSMPVVVGKIDQRTPAFDERLEYLEFNPDWRVPQEIVVNEYLPELRKDPGSLARKHIRLRLGAGKDAPEVDPRSVDWRQATPAEMERYVLRQDPGPWNALGTVKFMFPNKFNVYLHDTSEPRFFARHRRAYSHGCVRVSRPYELAAWVLAKEAPPWSLERIRATVASGQPANIPLAKPLPVHLIYRTALVEDNRLRFPADVYGLDGALEQALFGG